MKKVFLLFFFFLLSGSFIFSQNPTLYDVWDSTDPNNFVLVGQISAIQTAQTGKQHYNYFSASAHPIDVNVGRYNSNLWIQMDTRTGNLTFGFVFGMDNSRTPWTRSKVNFRIVNSDSDPFVSQSDDPGEAVETPAGSNAYLGNFYYANNTDGIAVSGLSGFNWTIIIDAVDYGPIINRWFASNGENLTTRSDDMELTIGNEYRITPAGNPPSGAPVVSEGVAADAGPDKEIDGGESVQIGGNPSAIDGTAPYTYLWEPATGLSDASSANPVASPGITTMYVLTVTDVDGETDKDTMTLTVLRDLIPPQLNCPQDLVVNNVAGECFAFVDFTVTASDNSGTVFVQTSMNSGDQFPIGTTSVSVTATDPSDNSTTCSFNVTVLNTTPYIIEFNDVVKLWPPNHKYRTVTLDDFLKSAVKRCESGSPSLMIMKVTSDEEEDAIDDDGNTLNDMVISFDRKSVQLRAERNGERNGRVYSIFLGDGNGYVHPMGFKVLVPVSKKSKTVEDAAMYMVDWTGINSGDPGGGVDMADIDELILEETPQEFKLFQNYPNPFNPETKIEYQVSSPSFVEISVYNILGERIKVLTSRSYTPGKYSTKFDGRDLESGIYFYVMRTENKIITKKMILSK